MAARPPVTSEDDIGIPPPDPVPGRSRPLTPRQAERRRRILDAARRLVAESGYDAVSMRAIAAASGAVEKTLFNIFGSKDRLLALAAYERSAEVFDLADRRVGKAAGWPWLMSLCDGIAELAMEYPAMAHALTVPLLDHSEFVGLDRLYDTHVGAALATMAQARALRAEAPLAVLARMIQLGVVSGVVFWSRDQIPDRAFTPYLRMRVAESLMPHATPATRPLMQEEIAAALAVLAAPDAR